MPSNDILLCGQCQDSFTVPTKLLEHPITSLTAKIRANHIPGRTEKNEIAEILVEVGAQLVRYEEELSRLRNTTAQIESQRKTLQQLVDVYTGLQAPVNRLPTEVLYDIFSRADWRDWKSSFYTEKTPRPKGLNPLSLSIVCSRWRAIVVGSPQLWTSVNVDLRLDDIGCPYTVETQLSILNAYLKRSGTLPLSIRVCNSDMYSGDFYKHHYLYALAEHCHRWRYVSLDLGDGYYVDDGALVAVRGKLPILQALEIKQAENIGDIFEICPMLGRVSVQYYGEEDHILPWEQITSLFTEDWGSDRDPLEAFELCPRMKELRLKADRFPNFLYDPISSELESLTIVVECYEEVDDRLLDALTLSHLTFFQMNVPDSPGQRGDAWDVPTSLSSLFCRSKCPLQTLILDDAPMYATGLLQALAAMPTITELRLTGENGLHITTALLHSLTYPARHSSVSVPSASRPAPLLPQLKHLALTATHCILGSIDPIDDTVLLDMLESRRSPEVLQAFGSGERASLDTVAILPVTILGPPSLTRLRRLRSEGLQVIRPDVD